jgi:O-antigen/teichoic acid export membrane protein
MGIIIKQTIKSSVYTYTGIILGFVTTAILMPKILLEEQVGLVRLLISIMILLAQVANLGYTAAGGRLFPYFRNPEKQHNGYLFWGCIVSSVGLLITLSIWSFNQAFVLDFLNVKASPLLRDYLFWVAPLTIFTVIYYIFDGYLRFLYDTISGTFLKDFLQRIFLLIAILVFYFQWIDFSGYVVLYVIALSFPSVLLVLRVWQKGWLFFKPIKGFWTKEMLRSFASLSVLTFLSGFTSQVVLYIDQIQVTSMMNLSANGIYATMMMFGTVIYTPTVHVIRIGGSIIAESWKSQDLDMIKDVYDKSCLNLLIVGCLLFMGVVANLNNIFEVIPNYEPGRWVVIWIGIGKLFDMATGLNGTILQTSKYYFYDTLFMVFLIVGTWLMNHWLIPIYGITGSAIATTSMVFAFNIFRTIFVWIAFGMFPFSLKNIYVLWIAGLVFWVISFIPTFPSFGKIPNFLIDTPLRSVLIGLLFIGTLYFTKISSDMNQIIDGFWAKLKRK